MAHRNKSSMDYVGLGCCALAVSLYLNTLNAGFVYDDRRAVLGNPDVLSSTPWHLAFKNDFWGTPLSDSGSHGSYRPLCVLSYKLNHLFGGFRPFGYHLVNVVLHCIATGLVLRLGRHLMANRWGPGIAAALFAAHPVHTEAVASVVGRADLFACVLYLLTFDVYRRHIELRERHEPLHQWTTLAASVLLSFLAILSKETAVSALLICGFYDVIRGLSGFRDKGRVRSLTILGLAFVATVHWRVSVLQTPTTMFSAADNPTAKATSFETRLLTFAYLPAFNFRLLILPSTLSFDWGMDAIPRITGILDYRNLFSILFYGLLVKTIWTNARILIEKVPVLLTHQRKARALRKRIESQVSHNNSKKCSSNANSFYVQKCLNSDYQMKQQPADFQKFQWGTWPPKAVGPVTTLGNMSVHSYGRLGSGTKRKRKLSKRAIESLTAYQNLGIISTFETTSDDIDSSSSSMSTPTFSSTYSSCSSSSASSSPVTSISYQFEEEIAPQPTVMSCPSTTTPTTLTSSMHPCVTVLVLIALMSLPFLPASNLLFYVGFVVAERILYLPSAGFCLLVGFGFSQLARNQNKSVLNQCVNFIVYRGGGGSAGIGSSSVSVVGQSAIGAMKVKSRQNSESSCYKSVLKGLKIGSKQQIVCVAVLLAICAMSHRTVLRNWDWRDEESLFRSAITVNPPKALGNLGSVLSSQGRHQEAKAALLMALEYRPNMADVHYNLGILQQNQQDYSGAVESFQRAIHFRPSLAVAYLNLGISLIALGKCQEAAVMLRKGSRLDGHGLRDRTAHENAKIASLLQLGGLYSEQGKLQRALAVYREALHILPNSYPPQGVYHRLGDTLAKLNQWTEAERFHRAAIQAQPDLVAAHLSYGSMLARNSSRASEAEVWFKKALKLAPLDPSVHHHYAEFLTSLSRNAEACEYRIRAAELSPNDYAIVVAAATSLRLLDRVHEAEKWYRQAVLLKPDDARAHTNLGAILHLLGQTKQAAASYKEALKLQPGDSTTLTNLAKLGIIEVA